jgi:hypothetical protein
MTLDVLRAWGYSDGSTRLGLVGQARQGMVLSVAAWHDLVGQAWFGMVS